MMLVRAGVSLAEISGSVSTIVGNAINNRVAKTPIKSIQRGIVSGNGLVNVSVVPVNVSKSFLILGGAYANDGVPYGSSGRLISASQIAIASGTLVIVGWELVEYV